MRYSVLGINTMHIDLKTTVSSMHKDYNEKIENALNNSLRETCA